MILELKIDHLGIIRILDIAIEWCYSERVFCNSLDFTKAVSCFKKFHSLYIKQVILFKIITKCHIVLHNLVSSSPSSLSCFVFMKQKHTSSSAQIPTCKYLHRLGSCHISWHIWALLKWEALSFFRCMHRGRNTLITFHNPSSICVAITIN